MFFFGHAILTWFFKVTLGWGPDFWTLKLQQLLDWYPDAFFWYYTAGLLVSFTVYWTWGGFYCLMDRLGWLAKYKIQPGTNQPPENKKFLKVQPNNKFFTSSNSREDLEIKLK